MVPDGSNGGGQGLVPTVENPERLVIFFDLDNTLYPASAGVDEQMKERIKLFFLKIGVESREVDRLAHQYYKVYGLTVRGLIKHHTIDPIDFDSFVDGSLDLERVIFNDPPLREMILNMIGEKYIFTNAGINHATRVLKLLGLYDIFKGRIIYCDYAEPNFACKPEASSYERALRFADISSAKPARIYLIDDSALNCHAATGLGWHTVHVTPHETLVAHHRIADVHDLPSVLPSLFTENYLKTWTCSTNSTEAVEELHNDLHLGMAMADPAADAVAGSAQASAQDINESTVAVEDN